MPRHPGEHVTVALLAGAAAADVWLVANGHDTISTCIRRKPLAKAITILLADAPRRHTPA